MVRPGEGRLLRAGGIGASWRSRLAWTGLAGMVLAGVVAWRAWHSPEAMRLRRDLRAGLAAREIRDPDQRLAKYLEGRYGDQSDPTRRREVFLDFFRTDRIEDLQRIVRMMPEERRQEGVDAMARWVEKYRASLADEERAALAAYFQAPEGSAMLRRATSQYNAQDVRYRGVTAPVISQLLKTLHDVGADR